jgi:hypothetical protein
LARVYDLTASDLGGSFQGADPPRHPARGARYSFQFGRAPACYCDSFGIFAISRA